MCLPSFTFTQVLLKLIQPYTRVRIPFISSKLNIPEADVEQLLITLILDNRISGHIDQVGCRWICSLIYLPRIFYLGDHFHTSCWMHDPENDEIFENPSSGNPPFLSFTCAIPPYTIMSGQSTA